MIYFGIFYNDLTVHSHLGGLGYRRRIIMYEYVSKKEVKPYRIICESCMQKLVAVMKQDYQFDCYYEVVGSGATGMITRNGKSSFDLDYNFGLRKLPEDYKQNLKGLKDVIRKQLDEIFAKQDMQGMIFSYGQDSTSSIGYHFKNSQIENPMFSMDVAIILGDKSQIRQRLIHQKENEQFYWNKIPSSMNLGRKRNQIREVGRNQELKACYLKLKNRYLSKGQEDDHPSYVVFIEAVNQVYNKYNKETKRMGKVSGNTHTNAQMNHHANQSNPNNGVHKSAMNNHSNQCNPNHTASKSEKK